jgi:hypothetical protein
MPTLRAQRDLFRPLTDINKGSPKPRSERQPGITFQCIDGDERAARTVARGGKQVENGRKGFETGSHANDVQIF